MKVGLVALHYPRPEHWDEMISRVHRAAEIMVATPGCLAVDCRMSEEHQAVVTTGQWESEQALMAGFAAVRTAGVDSITTSASLGPARSSHSPHADEGDSSAERPDLCIPADDRPEAPTVQNGSARGYQGAGRPLSVPRQISRPAMAALTWAGLTSVSRTRSTPLVRLVRKLPMTWSPVTESNRRPSPYHKYGLIHCAH